MFDTQFVGLDVAGEYLINHKLPSERVMHSSHQAYGLLWHGDIMGTKGIPDSVEKMEYARSELNANWLFVYNWDLNILQETNPLGIYIRDNYELKQFGFKIENDTLIPIYFLMKYGGSFSEEKINSNLHNQEIQEKKYEFSNREEVLNYINLE